MARDNTDQILYFPAESCIDGRVAYGICVKRISDNTELERVEDISDNFEFVKKLVDLFNSENLEIIHLYCAIEDALSEI